MEGVTDKGVYPGGVNNIGGVGGKRIGVMEGKVVIGAEVKGVAVGEGSFDVSKVRVSRG